MTSQEPSQGSSRRFSRTREDFKCMHCGFTVHGNGFTNHCPKCLWSRHVDVNPGDRASQCKGMMKPVSVEYDRTSYTITYVCERCGARKRNKASPSDSEDALLALVSSARKGT